MVAPNETLADRGAALYRELRDKARTHIASTGQRPNLVVMGRDTWSLFRHLCDARLWMHTTPTATGTRHSNWPPELEDVERVLTEAELPRLAPGACAVLYVPMEPHGVVFQKGDNDNADEPLGYIMTSDGDHVVGPALFWRPKGLGYTIQLSQAGLYPASKTTKTLRDCDTFVPKAIADKLAIDDRVQRNAVLAALVRVHYRPTRKWSL